MPTDARLEAFLADGPEVFASVQQAQSFWKPDPFDVATINVPARRTFERLVKRATRNPDSGKLFLLRGESGSGKTHLVRAFRHSVHSRGLGYVGYLPMTVDAASYDRYILSNLLDTLDRTYDVASNEDDTGLTRLSNALMKYCKSAFEPLIHDEGILEEHELHDMIRSLADELHENPLFRHVDVQLLRALIYLQRREAKYHHRVLQWLRCEDMVPADRQVLGDIVPRTADNDPMRMLTHLGRLMGAMEQALVLCVDQVEDISDFEKNPGMEPSFRRAINSLASFAGNVPTAVVVVCCLSDFWAAMRKQLTQSMIDRIENDPAPVTLDHLLTEQTAQDMVAQRMRVLLSHHGLEVDPADPTYPIPRSELERFSGLRVRDALNACRRFQEQACQDGQLPRHLPLPGEEKKQGDEERKQVQQATMDQKWTDFRAKFNGTVPEEDAEIVSLLAWAIEAGGDELGATDQFKVKSRTEASIDIALPASPQGLFVALCNRSPRGGGLGRQMAEALRSAARKLPVILRTAEFPSNPNGLVAEQVGALLRRGGRRAVVSNSDLREVVALQSFRKEHPETAFREWSRSARPLTRLKLVSDVLALEKPPPPPPDAPKKASAPALQKHTQGERHTAQLESARRSDTPTEKPSSGVREPQEEIELEGRRIQSISEPLVSKPAGRSPTPKEVPQQTMVAKTASDPKPCALRIGDSEGIFTRPVFVQAEELTKHSAFLGGSGSGKTTLALNLIEQLLLQGIPALLVDRKGDLAAYARDEAWQEELKDPAMEERRRLLRERVDVALYTPGRTDGRALAIPVVPRGLESLPPEEREQSVQQAADAISTMLEYRNSARDRASKALLAQALRLLVERPIGQELTLDLVQKFIASEDVTLVQETNGIDLRVFPKLAQDLATLRLNARSLLASQGEKLNMEELLGLGSAKVPGKTRLSVISTKFLGGTQGSLFWVSQLLVEANRWASQHPSSKLQAVLMFDEADMYLPAVGIPATKQPMENLLKRARSAGIGVMLATQSPGDLDYKCRENVRSWFIGRVREDRALGKLRPMFSDARVDPATRLPAQKMGQFHLLRDGQVEQLKADRNIIKTEQLSEEEILQLAHRSGEHGIRNAS
ncbi:helicase HerA domain-containing protein [Corallococcus interemptor]|uniref:helicase HerA domain-containing protein n=1 Tax=Corallococcus interemptor TaxID=2316720 RepID=UPI003D007B18